MAHDPGPEAGQTPGADCLVLGIETSCDETAAAVVARAADGRGTILSNLVRSQWEQHRPYGGVVPEIAARAHVECLDEIIAAAIAAAGIGFGDLAAVAATAGPGLIGGVLVGLTAAKAIALVHDLPLIAVNHLEAHALTAGLTDGLRPPYVLLLVSGGHTQLLLIEGVGQYVRLGTTIDDALGEAFDKTAKLLGLPQPGGPSVEQAARAGRSDRFPLPRPMLGRPEPHFSFAGLKTAVRLVAQAAAPLDDQAVADLCASFEQAVVETVVDRTRTALRIARARSDADVLVVAGGVAANQRLRAGLHELAAREGVRLSIPPIALCTDNAAMVAWAGAELLARNKTSALDFAARARWPLDAGATPVIGSGRLGMKA
ncbi:MAG: tRNA (adenosine(37)-N6)-threonylcarbamoyltransferase complex transferase subunit TsaD [Hyphomicrobiaceae bacterium]